MSHRRWTGTGLPWWHREGPQNANAEPLCSAVVLVCRGFFERFASYESVEDKETGKRRYFGWWPSLAPPCLRCLPFGPMCCCFLDKTQLFTTASRICYLPFSLYSLFTRSESWVLSTPQLCAMTTAVVGSLLVSPWEGDFSAASHRRPFPRPSPPSSFWRPPGGQRCTADLHNTRILLVRPFFCPIIYMMSDSPLFELFVLPQMRRFPIFRSGLCS